MNPEVSKILSRVVLADRPVRIKLLGDSITHGVGGTGFDQTGEPITAGFSRNPGGYCWANCFMRLMMTRYNCIVTNNACTGTNIEFILEHFDELVSPEDDIVICAIGTNNRHQDFKDAPMHSRLEHMHSFYAHLLELDERLRTPARDVIYIANIPAAPNRESDPDDGLRLFHVGDLNDMYARAAAERGFAWISLYNLFYDYCELHGLEPDELLADGLHPNDRGHRAIFEIIMHESGLARPEAERKAEKKQDGDDDDSFARLMKKLRDYIRSGDTADGEPS